MYTRVIPEPISFKVYGFNKVSTEKLNQIVIDMQKPTQIQVAQSNARAMWTSTYLVPRPPFKDCAHVVKYDPSSSRPGTGKDTLDGRTVQKVVRRLQRPTLSIMASEGNIAPTYELEFCGKARSRKPKTPEEERKVLERIQRPTTASRRKLFGHTQCLLCEELMRSSVHETMRNIVLNERASHHHNHHHQRPTTRSSGTSTTPTRCLSRSRPNSSARDNGKTSRAESATHASRGGKPACPRLTGAVAGAMRMPVTSPRNAPLISGLPRSEKIDDITRRLHPAAGNPPMISRSLSRRTTETPITVYG